MPCSLAQLEEILVKVCILQYKCQMSTNKEDLKYIVIDIVSKQNLLEDSFIMSILPRLEEESMIGKIQLIMFVRRLSILLDQHYVRHRRQNSNIKLFIKKFPGVSSFLKKFKRLLIFRNQEDTSKFKRNKIHLNQLVIKINELRDSLNE